MKILITGGSGLIGRHLTARMLAEGHDVHWLSRNPRPNTPLNIHVHPFDLNHLPNIPDLDAIVNLAGEPIFQRWTPAVKRRLIESRLQTTKALADAITAGQYTPKVWISGSAIGIYGNCGNTPLYESHTSGSGFLAELAAQWEAEATASVRTVLLRTGIVLADHGTLPLMTTGAKWGLGAVLGSGRQYLPWIHIDDLTRLIVFALEDHDLSGPVNASAPNPVTMEQFMKSVGQHYHRPQIIKIPESLLTLGLGELASVVCYSQNALPDKALSKGFTFNFPSLPAALADLLA